MTELRAPTTTPTEPGWFYAQIQGDPEILILRVSPSRSEKLFAFLKGTPQTLDNFIWYGPIPECRTTTHLQELVDDALNNAEEIAYSDEEEAISLMDYASDVQEFCLSLGDEDLALQAVTSAVYVWKHRDGG